MNLETLDDICMVDNAETVETNNFQCVNVTTML
jgi:hypothetical protein